MKKIITKLLVFLIYFIPHTILGQDMTAGFNFLKLGIGARACALGESFVSIADDGSAIYWNPAGLGNISRTEFLAMHSEWLLDTRLEYLSSVIPVKLGTIGGSGTLFLSGNIEGRDEYGQITQPYTNFDFAGTFAYGKNIATYLLIGAGSKLIYKRVGRYSGYGIGMDMGCLLRTPLGLNWGLVIQNLGPGIKIINEKTMLPLTLRLGVSYSKIFLHFKIMPTFDLQIDGEIKKNIGLEVTIQEVLALRIGYRTGLGQQCYTAGIGVNHIINKVALEIDYTYINLSSLHNGHRLSLKFRI
ncbi:MAG: PorV/PorQ family protein [candidate division WOR-3 bacterium]|nr:PorV/PorQ family protein [candidate division WOR-3 bacterium]